MSDSFSLPRRFNIADHLILPNLAPGRAERTYLTCGEDRLTFAGVHGQANRVAGALRRLGLRPGERVLLLMRESLAFPPCFWGAVRAGAVPVPVNPALTAADYRHFLADSGARMLIADAELWPLVESALADVLLPPKALIANGGVEGQPSLADAMAAESAEFDTVAAAPEDPAFWLYTSGSTGRPRAAVHRHRDMAFVVEHYLRRVLRLEADDVGFSAPKLFFAYGLGNALYFPLATGSRAVILPGPATADTVFAILARHRPTVFYGVPSHYRALLERYEHWLQDGGDAPDPLPRLEHLRLAISGGEALPPALYHRWRERFGLPILDALGSSEALHFYLANTPEHHRPGSVGRLVHGYRARLVTPDGGDALDGQAGELWLQGGSLAARTGDPEGWLATGDRLSRDRDGFYFYEGRVDDMLKIGGSWVAPAEVEAVLGAHPAVAECAVVGQPDPSGLTRAIAHVVLHPGQVSGPEMESALLAHAAGVLPPFKVPAQVRFEPALSRTATGKIRRFVLREAPGAPSGRAGNPA